MTDDTEKEAKKKARNEKRAEKLMQDETAKPAAAQGMNGATLRTKDLIDMVSAASVGKKPSLRQTVEATLEAIGMALATGKDLNVPPLGKLRVAKNKPPVMTLKLRLADGPKAAGLALADEDEDS